ncbi:MAG: PQQ-binding-like beta-propeller repeat protein [candidate division Zixibacteria bacterium]|nr:PQQ-binding-like beta-propeller repeat protein [candidate division Zixibacteria bacterium]
MRNLISIIIGLSIGLLGDISLAQDAGELIWQFQGPEDHCVCVTGFSDVDGDGNADVVGIWGNSAYQGDHNLFCLSGAGDNGSPEILWSVGPQGGISSGGGYGDQCLARFSDIDSNGIDEIILGTAWGGRCAFLINGTDGETRWVFDTYENPPTGWCYSVHAPGDLNFDDVPDVLAGFGSEANSAYALSGQDGSVIWGYEAGDAVFAVASMTTINWDNTPEAILGTGDPYEDRVICINGGSNGTGELLWDFHTGETVMDVEGFVDVNNDGLQDVLAGSWSNHVYCLSAIDGTEIWSSSALDRIMGVKVGGDQNDDGIPEVLVASWDNTIFSLDGLTGEINWSTPVGSQNGGDVWTLDNVPDVNDDGIDEVTAGSFDCRVYLCNGHDGEILWSYDTGNRLKSVRAAGDLNGDGRCDVVAGTQYLSNGGKMYAISGGDATSINQEPRPSHPVEFALHGNYPNPFNSSTNINFTLTYGGKTDISIYDITGRKVAVLADDYLSKGTHSIYWNADGFPSGVYFAKLVSGENSTTIRMSLIK